MSETDATRGRTRVKICGLTAEEDRDVAIAAGADAIGVISSVPVDTPRDIKASKAARLLRDLPPLVTGVLVTMPASVNAAVTLQERVKADAVQIHGGLAPEDIEELSNTLAAQVIVAVEHDQEDIEAYADVADLVLVDSATTSGAGGTGETHDWEATAALVDRLDTPVMLAGGLTPENVSAAITEVEPFAVDTASGVENDGGSKDHDAVRSFVTTAQGVHR